MVRTIDGNARRAELAEAVWRVILRDGMDAASVRGVAAEAELSPGSVRHFFASQTELHVFAMNALADRVTERIAARQAITNLRERAEAILAELLPLTDQTHQEFGVWLEFLSRARVDPALREVAERTATEARELVHVVVDGLRELGELPPTIDVEGTAVRLNALIDGLTLELIYAPHLISRTEARAVLSRELDALR